MSGHGVCHSPRDPISRPSVPSRPVDVAGVSHEVSTGSAAGRGQRVTGRQLIASHASSLARDPTSDYGVDSVSQPI